jgi:protein-S-isoprenylcysteine O-methyltransferase Ste14
MSRNPDSPGVIVFPPFLYAGTMVLGLVLHFLFPVEPLHALPARILGAVLFVASGLLARWGKKTMVRTGTNVRPDLPATVLVLDGPFRFTRNPLYLATTGLYIAVALLVDDLWPMVLLVPMLAVLEWGIVRREERYLEMKFGEPYRAYKAQVRRWF